MTAEIAILNKSAVALAADSAMTIGAGSGNEKIFDSADKLFELTSKNPIAIMIYNGADFAETPLSLLIRKFRNFGKDFRSVEDAAVDFLNFLNKFGLASPDHIRERNEIRIIHSVLNALQSRFEQQLNRFISEIKSEVSFQQEFSKILDGVLDMFLDVYSGQKDAQFIRADGTAPNQKNFRKIAESYPFYALTDAKQKRKLTRLCRQILRKNPLSDGRTGLVFAGFGTDDLFPTLVSFEIDGIVDGGLKFNRVHSVDIDRNGPRAKVLPFAQKEMVERFIFGIDTYVEDKVALFCERVFSAVREEIKDVADQILGSSSLPLTGALDKAEKVFSQRLRGTAFEKIRERSQKDIEDMVEFMPKPEMAKMAEALINLTSLKRRVSRGVETVGGPIDVAVLSQSEGFVWVRRKHYFPSELNPRYLERVKATYGHAHEGDRNGSRD